MIYISSFYPGLSANHVEAPQCKKKNHEDRASASVSTLNIRKDLISVAIGARWGSLSISETSDHLGFSGNIQSLEKLGVGFLDRKLVDVRGDISS